MAGFNERIAYFLLRITLGVNVFLHGFTRLIGNHAAFASYMEKQMRGSPVPGFLVNLTAAALPWGETCVGLLIMLGLWTTLALIAGGLLMLVLQIGTCLAQNWEIAGDQLIYVLLYFILLSYRQRDCWGIDPYLKRNRVIPPVNPPT